MESLTWAEKIITCIFAGLSAASILTAVIWIIVRYIFQQKNLKRYNIYKHYASIVPFNKDFSDFKDQYAGYSYLVDEKDKLFSFYNFKRTLLANRALKITNNNYKSFFDALREARKSQNETQSPILDWWNPFSFPFFVTVKLKDVELNLEYKIKDISMFQSIDSLMILLELTDKCKNDIIARFPAKQSKIILFEFNDHRFISLPNWKRSKDKNDTQANAIITFDKTTRLFKYEICSLGERTMEQCWDHINKHYPTKINYYPNAIENEKKINEAGLAYLQNIGFIKFDR